MKEYAMILVLGKQVYVNSFGRKIYEWCRAQLSTVGHVMISIHAQMRQVRSHAFL